MCAKPQHAIGGGTRISCTCWWSCTQSLDGFGHIPCGKPFRALVLTVYLLRLATQHFS